MFVEVWKLLPSIITILVLFNAMKLGESRTVFNELIPRSAQCSGDGDYGCICHKSQGCDKSKFLECIDGKCGCEFPKRRSYDHSLGKCVSLVGSWCSIDEGSYPECIRNSECEGGRCTCREGYGKTESSTCMINHGQECGPKQCNFDRGLACKEGTCQCADSSYVYSAIQMDCIDPEAVVRNFVQRVAERLVKEIFRFKLKRIMEAIMKPIRAAARLATLGTLG